MRTRMPFFLCILLLGALNLISNYVELLARIGRVCMPKNVRCKLQKKFSAGANPFSDYYCATFFLLGFEPRYRDSKEWKPFHHDAAAVKADKARTQNFTVAVSFGLERDAAFEHAKTK